MLIPTDDYQPMATAIQTRRTRRTLQRLPQRKLGTGAMNQPYVRPATEPTT